MKKSLLTSFAILLSVSTGYANHRNIAQKTACFVIPSIIATAIASLPETKTKIKPDQVVIQPLDRSNQNQIDQIITLCKKHERMLFAPDQTTEKMVKEHLAYMKKQKNTFWLKAHIDTVTLTNNADKIIGTTFFSTAKNQPKHSLKEYLVVNNIQSFMHVFQLVVEKDFQGQGLGTLMLQNLINQAEQNKLDAVILEVYNENTSMRTLITKLGFQPIFIDLAPTKSFSDGTTSYTTTYCLKTA
ncbi:GNAT family N-acetyltransferase [Candidatus Babeliales bacterium]|nr:GNAT family N-acetyltransferase [Candidatus Babeliales bacterium]